MWRVAVESRNSSFYCVVRKSELLNFARRSNLDPEMVEDNAEQLLMYYMIYEKRKHSDKISELRVHQAKEAEA